MSRFHPRLRWLASTAIVLILGNAHTQAAPTLSLTPPTICAGQVSPADEDALVKYLDGIEYSGYVTAAILKQTVHELLQADLGKPPSESRKRKAYFSMDPITWADFNGDGLCDFASYTVLPPDI